MKKIFSRFEKFVGAVLICVMACVGLASAQTPGSVVSLPVPTTTSADGAYALISTGSGGMGYVYGF